MTVIGSATSAPRSTPTTGAGRRSVRIGASAARNAGVTRHSTAGPRTRPDNTPSRFAPASARLCAARDFGWIRERRRPCPIRPRLLPQAGLGHERDPALHLGGMEGGELGCTEPGGLEADGAELVLHVGLLDDVDDGLAQGRARILRHARRSVDAEPSGELDAGHTGLLEGR